MDDPASDSALRFQRLATQRMYGRRFDLEISEVGPEVNVIAGPNGCGKTTLARTIGILVWPEAHGWERPIVEGAFQVGEGQWHVRVEAGRVQVQPSGGAGRLPPMPPHDHRDRYHLYLHDLLGATEGSEKGLANAILQEAQGGYDVQGAARALGFGEYKKGANLTETKNLEEAQRRVEEARQKRLSLEEEERSLTDLERRREEARAAAAREDALAQAIVLKEAQREARVAEEKLSGFPDKMEAVQGDEADRLSDLRESREEARASRQEAKKEIEEAKQEIEANLLPEEGLPDSAFETLRTAVQEWEKAKNAVEQAERERSRAEEAERQEWSRLPVEDKAQAASFSLPELDEVQSLAESRLEVEGQEKAMEAMERLFGGASPHAEPGTLRRGIERLEEWLREPSLSGGKPSSGALRFAGIALSVGTILLGGYLALGGALLGWVVGLLGALLGALFYLLAPPEGQGTRRPGLQERFERLDVEGPETWSSEAVQKRLDELVEEWTEARLETAKAEEWDRQKSMRDGIDGEKKRLGAERRELAERLGVSPETKGHGLLWFVQRLGAWQDAYAEAQAKGAEIEEATGQLGKWKGKAQEITQPYDTGEVTDLSDGKAALEQIRDARQALGQAKTKLQTARKARDQASRRIEDIQEKTQAIYERLGITPGDYRAVEKMCDRAEAYQEARAEADRKRQKAQLEEERLREEPGFEERMLSAEVETLRQEKDKARALAKKEEELSDQISRINQKIKAAKEKHDLENALAERASARSDLEERRREDLRSMVGQALADVVHQRTRNQDLPDVFERADELFRQITTDRCRLDLARDDGTFQVVTSDERRLGLSGLSGGTKVQLLLAVRIAFVERQEQGAKLPLVLDETLANSDDVKARSVIEAVRSICEEGRQVFYLTAQSDEVAKWQNLLHGTGTGLTVHELSGEEATAGEGFGELGGDGALSSGRPSTPDLPNPEEAGHEGLRDILDVARWSPRNSVQTLPLWYLTTDTGLLCRAAEKSYRTWGQLSSLAERGALSLIGLSEAEYERMEALARAVSAWRDAWLVGRGKPVGRPALEETSAVSENFIDEVTSLAKRVDRQAGRIIEKLREGAVKRFRSDKIEELKAYFQEEGYLSRRSPLSPADRWRRTLSAVSDEIAEGQLTEEEIEATLDRILESI